MRIKPWSFILLVFSSVAGPVFGQVAMLRGASTVQMPARADCNSPAFWIDDQLHIINSTGLPGTPVISQGGDQFSQYGSKQVQMDRQEHFPMWIESVWQDSDGTLYGWYHHEPTGVCGGKLTAPKIGALVSYDGGSSFIDMGIVLSSGDPIDCNAKNGFFAGGNGDFSVILDREQRYFYFLFDNYGGDVSGQGVVIARMAFEDRMNPVGAVWKYSGGEWMEPGLGGRNTPIFPTAVSWQRSDTNSFWGASVHWNTYLQTFVVLLNHTCCKPNWPQEGIYVTYNPDLSNPAGWTTPVKILGKVSYDAGFYPQVIGMAAGESDTVAGQVARLYVHGRSNWEVLFLRPEDIVEPPPTDPPGPVEPTLDETTSVGPARLRR
jgi:hypothetical protein